MNDDFEPAEPVAPPGVQEVLIVHPFGYLNLVLDGADVDYNMADVIGALVRPALLAHGFSVETVNDYVPEVY